MSIAETLAATPVSDLDLTRYVTVPVDASVSETVAEMCAQSRSCACIMDGAKLAGIFTQRDVLLRVVGRPSTWDRPIAEEIARKVRTMLPGDSVSDGLATMIEWWVRNVPVLDEDDRLVGNLHYFTIMQTIADVVTGQNAGAEPGPKVRHGFDLVDFTGLNTSTPVTIELDDTADVAAHHMKARGIGSVLIVDERENLVGMLTEFDLQMKLGCQLEDLSSVPVKDIMAPDPVALSSRSSITEAIKEMAERSFAHVPLLGESGRPVGVASFRDIAAYFETSLEAME